MDDERSVGSKCAASEVARFPATRWSLIAKAQASNSGVIHGALTEICEHYWPPIYAFLRRTGHSREDAEDLTQGFFASLLAREVFARVEREGGKLRTFLLASLKNHLHNEYRAGARQKRGGGAEVVRIDAEESERRIQGEMADEMTPERAFDRAWVLNLLGTALTSLEQEYLADNKGALFTALRPQLVDAASVPYAELAERFGMSEGALRVAVHRLRVRYRELLIQEVAETVEGPAAVKAELDFLLRTIG
jgi:RNA polymerase sigma-70 factor (ECF subfamily)